MAIIQNTGFYRGFSNGAASPLTYSAASNFIKIYQTLANMPADADNYLEANHTADLLATFNNWTLVIDAKPATADDPNFGKLVFSTFPNPNTVNGTGTGTAAWYAMYRIPYVFLGEVTLSAGTGTLQIDSLSIINGSPVQLLDWSVVFKI